MFMMINLILKERKEKVTTKDKVFKYDTETICSLI